MQDPSPFRTIYNVARAGSPLNLVVANNGSRPAPRERIKTPEAYAFKNNPVSPLKKVKPTPPITNNTQAQTIYLNGNSVVRNPTIQEDSCESLTFEEIPKSTTINTGASKAKLHCPDTIQSKKENRFRTLNTTKGDTRDDEIFMDKYLMNYSTLNPVERPGTSFKRGRGEDVTRQNSRFETRKDTEEYIQYELGRRRTNAEQHFPSILKPPGPMTINQKLTEIESIYSTTLYSKSRSKSPFQPAEIRKKPNGRAQSNLVRRESSTRKAVSQIKAEIDRYNSTPSNTQFDASNGKVIKKLDFDLNKTTYPTRDHSLTPNYPHTKDIKIPGASHKPRSKSSMRPKNQMVFSNTEKNQSVLNKNNSSDIYLEEYETSYYFENKSNKNILIEDPSKEVLKTDDPQSKKGALGGGIATDDHFSHPNLGNNNYIDSIEIKKDNIQNLDKEIPHWKPVKKSAGMASPKERQGKFVRKHNSEAHNKLKREESNKNILDEFAEKNQLILDPTPTEPIEHHHNRSVSKSPFDELLETSLMSYDKDSMVISRTKKDLETYLKTKKNFKRSKVIVSKGHQASLEKDASTNMTISKSTFPNESQDSKEIDFGFEDDIILNKKNVKATIPSTQKQSMPLNVIHEEQPKGTINASQDLENELIKTEDNEPDTPTGKKSNAIKPIFFYRGKKMTKADNPVEEPEKKEIFSDENPIDDDDDLCENGDNESDL